MLTYMVVCTVTHRAPDKDHSKNNLRLSVDIVVILSTLVAHFLKVRDLNYVKKRLFVLRVFPFCKFQQPLQTK